ncbi:DUF4376 domain-containing protein, partial [Escherichia coli]
GYCFKLPEKFFRTDADNNDVPMTAASLMALSEAAEQAMFKKGVEINTRQLQMKSEVRALQTLEEICVYRIGWPEATGE